MFGRERSQNGVLVEPKKEYLFEVNDDAKLESFKDAIWFVVSFKISHVTHRFMSILGKVLRG
jgi:hypothetical protein